MIKSAFEKLIGFKHTEDEINRYLEEKNYNQFNIDELKFVNHYLSSNHRHPLYMRYVSHLDAEQKKFLALSNSSYRKKSEMVQDLINFSEVASSKAFSECDTETLALVSKYNSQIFNPNSKAKNTKSYKVSNSSSSSSNVLTTNISMKSNNEKQSSSNVSVEKENNTNKNISSSTIPSVISDSLVLSSTISKKNEKNLPSSIPTLVTSTTSSLHNSNPKILNNQKIVQKSHVVPKTSNTSSKSISNNGFSNNAVFRDKARSLLFNQLVNQTGVTRNEVIDLLKGYSDSDVSTLTADEALFTIVMRRTEHEENHQNQTLSMSDLMAADIRMMDEVILLSEGERETIANRKKRRRQELCNSCEEPLKTAEEFSKSILLNLFEPSSSSSSSSSNSSFIVALANLFVETSCRKKVEDDHSPKLKKCENSEFSSNSSNSPICNCNSLKLKLKSIVTQLLYLEQDSIKFHPKTCSGYFKDLSNRLQTRFSSLLPDLAREFIKTNEDSEKTEEIDDKKCIEEIFQFITEEIEILRTNLYLTSNDQCMVPSIFRKFDSRFDFQGRLSAKFDIEDDGFEIVE